MPAYGKQLTSDEVVAIVAFLGSLRPEGVPPARSDLAFADQPSAPSKPAEPTEPAAPEAQAEPGDGGRPAQLPDPVGEPSSQDDGGR